MIAAKVRDVHCFPVPLSRVDSKEEKKENRERKNEREEERKRKMRARDRRVESASVFSLLPNPHPPFFLIRFLPLFCFSYLVLVLDLVTQRDVGHLGLEGRVDDLFFGFVTWREKG